MSLLTVRSIGSSYVKTMYVCWQSYQFGEVHVSQNSHDNSGLCVIRIGPFCCSKCAQDRQDIAETEVIVDLREKKKNKSSSAINKQTNQSIFKKNIIVLWSKITKID